MMKHALCLVIALSVTGCDLFVGSSKVAHGERYQSDDSRFDPYFDTVHQQQVAAAAWPDEKKAARKPLIDALTLPPSATDDAIVNATRTRAKNAGGKLDVATAHVTPAGQADPPFFAAVEESVRLELDRARKRRATATQLDDLAKKGDENKRTADREYENRGAEKADPKKSDKKNELRRELGAAVTAMRDMESNATKDAQSGQDFLEDIGDALEGAPKQRPSKPLPSAAPPPPTTASTPPPPDPKPTKKPSKPSKPASTTTAAPPPPAADRPKPPPPPPDDVFNP